MPKDEAKPLTDARLAEIREEVAGQRRFMEAQARIVHLTPRHFVRIEEDLLAEIDRLRGVIAEASAEVGHMLDERTEDTQLLDWAGENFSGPASPSARRSRKATPSWTPCAGRGTARWPMNSTGTTMSESRRYGTMFGSQGQPLILDTTTKQKLALGAACTRLNEQQAEIDRLNGLVEALMPRTDEELEAELNAAEAVPISEEMIRGMVKFATDDDYRAISEQNFGLRREVDRLKAENATILARIDTLMPIVEDAVARAIGEDEDDED